MRWFKHFSAARSDSKLVTIRSEFGLWGIGAYWTILEMVAEQMKGKNPQAEASFVVSELCSLFGCKRNKLETFLERLQDIRGMNVKYSGNEDGRLENILRIEVPKLLEINDNYSKDLKVSTKNLPSKEVEGEVEREEEQNTQMRVVDFETLWNRYPSQVGKLPALKAFKETVKTQADMANIRAALNNYLNSGRVARGFVMDGGKWFTNWREWVNDPEPASPADENDISHFLKGGDVAVLHRERSTVCS